MTSRASAQSSSRSAEPLQYKTRFPRIDTYEQVDDEREISRLTNLLTAEIAAGNLDRLDLMPPERVSDETAHYRLRPTGTTVVEPDGRLLRHLPTRTGVAPRASTAG